MTDDEQNSTTMPNMDTPAFKGESQTDRAARAALLTLPIYKTPCQGYKTVHCKLPDGHTGDCKYDSDVPF